MVFASPSRSSLAVRVLPFLPLLASAACGASTHVAGGGATDGGGAIADAGSIDAGGAMTSDGSAPAVDGGSDAPATTIADSGEPRDAGTTPGGAPSNLIVNGDFAAGNALWQTTLLLPANPGDGGTGERLAGRELCYDMGPGEDLSVTWPSDPTYAPALSPGVTYEIALQVSASAPLQAFQINVQQAVSPFAPDFAIDGPNAGASLQTFAYTFTIPTADASGGLAFGFTADAPTTVCFADVFLAALVPAGAAPAKELDAGVATDAGDPPATRTVAAFIDAQVPERGGGPALDYRVTVYEDGSAERVMPEAGLNAQTESYPPGSPDVMTFLSDLAAAGDVSSIATSATCSTSLYPTYVIVGTTMSGNLACGGAAATELARSAGVLEGLVTGDP